MRRLSGILFIMSFVFAGLNAEPVTKEGAKKVAERFTYLYNTESERTIDDVITYYLDNGLASYHFVKLNPTGWVLVSGDDVLTPVIGYSFTNPFVPREQMEESAKVWFSSLDRHIGSTLEKPGLSEHTEWTGLFETSTKKAAEGTAVEPLIKVKWNQGSGWNRFCPEDEAGPGGHVYAGCVAVSIAQAMSVYQYPVQPQGEHGYNHDTYGYLYVNYAAQEPYNWGEMSSSSADDENARLLYHVAVAVDMGFGPDGSGAYTRKSAGITQQFFGYSKSGQWKYRENYSDDVWKQMLIDELVLGRPIIYSGDGDDGKAGHAFNVDGVGADGSYFHLNWGWSGSGNGYFLLTALTPNSYDFSYNNGALFGFKPPSAGPYDISLSNTTAYDQQEPGTFVSLVDVADEFEDNVYSYVLKGGFNVILDDFGPADFEIRNDSLFTTKVFDSETSASEPLTIEVTDTLGNFFSKDFEISIEKFYFGPTELSLSNTSAQEGKASGHFVGTLDIIDDIPNNTYTYGFLGGYNSADLSEEDCFFVRNDSLLTNKMFFKAEGLVYYLELTLLDKYENVLTESFEIDITDNLSGGTGIEDRILNNVKVYPNPASGLITIEFESELSAQIDIINISGQTCIKCALDQNQQLDVSGLSKGVYMLLVRAGNEVSRVKLVISE